MSIEKEIILHVLDMYRHMPFLWDKNHSDYKNKISRGNGNRLLLEAYKKYDETATVQTVTKKIQNLRTNYYKELQKVKESYRDGAEVQDIYKPSLWYYDALSFLGDNSENCRQKMDPLKTENISPSSSDAESSYQNSETYAYTPPMKKKKLTKTVPLQHTNFVIDGSGKPTKMRDEEWEILGKAIGLQLRDLDKKQLTITQKIISDAIYYAKFGLLTQNSYINLAASPAPP